jgi:hypothetical protein
VRGVVIVMAHNKKKRGSGSGKTIKIAAAEVPCTATLTFVSGTFITADLNQHL